MAEPMQVLQQALAQGRIRLVDLQFAAHLQALQPTSDGSVLLLAALTSQAVGQGDVCVDLPALVAGSATMAPLLQLPSAAALAEALRAWPAVGEPGAQTPLILEQDRRLYLGRYWWYEQQVASDLQARAAAAPAAAVDLSLLREGLARLFPPGSGIDWQRVAAATAVLRRLAVISGGPGTGKTHTVASILALLLEQAGGQRCRIALTAPTGKAAARLTEALRKARERLACAEHIKQLIPDETSTIHRLIGMRPGFSTPRFHRDNPLDIDLLVVDEASMVDLPTMARLLAALPAGSRLILLGDKDQLASVEAGSVFADISGAGAGSIGSAALREQPQQVCGFALPAAGSADTGTDTSDSPSFGDSVVLLRQSYRFRDDAGIGALARAINAGAASDTLELLQQSSAELQWRQLRAVELPAAVAQLVQEQLAALFDAASAAEALAVLERFRILCAVRKGPFGVEQLNREVENVLRQRALISGSAALYRGRPLMITHNAPALGLFNGDVGIVWPAADGTLKAWFLSPDLTLKAVSPARLPEHETAWAMTVHKSQGSEFERVLLVLPNDINPVLTRELLYTGVTRAKGEVQLWAAAGVVEHCVRTRVSRVSGLAEKLGVAAAAPD